MVALVIVLSLFWPRLTTMGLWFLSSWFQGVFQTWYWPALGIVFLPHTTLWYSAVVNWYDGQWGFLQVFLLVLSVLVDLGVVSVFGHRQYRR